MRDMENIPENTKETENNTDINNCKLLYPSQGYLLWDGTEICIKKEHGKLVVYKPDKFGQFTDIYLSILTSNIFSEQTKNKLFKFIQKYTNAKNTEDFSVNLIVDKFYNQYKSRLIFEDEQNKLKLEFEKKQRILKQMEFEAKERLYREKFEANRPKDLLDVVEFWDKLFSNFSKNNPEYSSMTLHLLLGQCIVNCRLIKVGLNLDPRISVMYFKPSGTGGSAGFNIVSDVAEKIGLKCNVVSSATDAAMIGSVETKEDEEGERVVVPILGILDKSKSNIIYWSEPEGLFEKNNNQHEGNIRRYIQSGLNLIDDKESTLSRDMKNGTVKAKCEASIMLATVPPQSITDKVIDSGLMQRFCFINKIINVDERIQNAMWDSNNVAIIKDDGSINKKSIYDQIQLEKIVVEKLLYLKKWGETHLEFGTTEETIQYINIQEHKMFKQIQNLKNVTERVKEKMESFQQFTVRRGWQFAMHRAALRFSNKIETQDMKYVFENLITPQMNSMLYYLESNWINEVVSKKEQSEEDILRQKYHEFRGNNPVEEVTKKEFIEIMSKTFKKSQNTIYLKFKKYIEKKLIIESEKGFVSFSDEIITTPNL